MDADNIITGWDNALHPKEIGTFSHHKHVGNSVAPSARKELEGVLKYIQALMENKE